MDTHFSKREIISLLAITLLGVLLSVGLHIPLVIGFTPGFIILVIQVRTKGLPAKNIAAICKRGVARAKGVILILLLVSFLLPSWYISGTIDQLVGISLHLITPEHFLVLSFVITMFFSMILGTSVGTLSSIGLPIISTAAALNMPLEMVAGALVSGAFVGDRTSPFSSAHQLLSHTVEVPVKRQFQSMLFSTVTAVAAGIFFFGFLDLTNTEWKSAATAEFHWSELSLVKFLPPLLLIASVAFRVKIINAFLLSIGAACILALTGPTSFSSLVHSLVFGIEGLGGGLSNMYLLLLFLALAGAYNGLLEELSVIQPILDRWLSKSSSLFKDTLKTMGATLGITLIAANQTLPIILTGRSFLPHWEKYHSKEQLARVMADSSMLFPGMIPWSVLAIMCSTVLGVPLFSYLPYAVFIWVLPLVTLVLSLVKGMAHTKSSGPLLKNTDIHH